MRWILVLIGCLLLGLATVLWSPQMQESSRGSAVTGPPSRIIFITIDTLRADHLPFYGYPRMTAPFLSSLAEQGVVFEKAYSAAPHTAPSHTTMFTGLFPFQHGVRRNQETLAGDVPNLYGLLSAAGWTTVAFPAVTFLDGKVGFPKSPVPLQLYDKTRERRSWYLMASEVVDNVEQWLNSQQQPDKLFMWLHFYDVHQWKGKRFIPPQYMQQMKASGDDELIEYLVKHHNTPVEFFKGKEGTLRAMNGYDARLRFVDDQLRRLHGLLESRQLTDNSIWVVTSDHGEGLGNHNYEGHGEFLYQEQLHVPLVFSASDRRFPARRLSELVRTVDLFPTLLHFAGIGQHPMQEGKSLLSLLHEGEWKDAPVEFSYAERRPKDYKTFRKFWEEGEIYSVHDLERKLIEHSQGIDELFDLSQDPFEETSILGQDATAEQALRHELAETLKRRDRDRTLAEEQPLTEQQIEELKSLGYL